MIEKVGPVLTAFQTTESDDLARKIRVEPTAAASIIFENGPSPPAFSCSWQPADDFVPPGPMHNVSFTFGSALTAEEDCSAVLTFE